VKRIIDLFVALSLALAVLVSQGRTVSSIGETHPDSEVKKTLKFTNGQWFNGHKFQHQTFYSVDGILTIREPTIVGEVIDLKNGYVVPPFGDAHNHYIAGPHDIDKILDQYLRDGIFYAKNPASIATRN
jgi:hypothetical protein